LFDLIFELAGSEVEGVSLGAVLEDEVADVVIHYL
jgi:hypothetical protein